MRIIVSVLFILITIISVARPLDSFCVSLDRPSKFETNLNVASYDIAGPSGSHAAEHLACDACHIGHCSFIMTSNFVTSHYGKTKLFGFVKNKIRFSEFNQNLFRPPIV